MSDGQRRVEYELRGRTLEVYLLLLKSPETSRREGGPEEVRHVKP